MKALNKLLFKAVFVFTLRLHQLSCELSHPKWMETRVTSLIEYMDWLHGEINGRGH